MNLFLRLSLLVLLSSLAWLTWQRLAPAEMQQTALTKASHRTSCLLPIAWRLGTLDPAFELSRAQALYYIEQASDRWHQATGRQLFVQDQDRGFAIHFQFDARQQKLLQQQLLQHNLQRYDAAIVPSLQKLPEQMAELDRQIKEFNQQQQGLQQQISQWRPDQPEAATRRQQLEQQQQRMTREAQWLEQQRQQLQRDQDYLNETIRQRNALLPTDRHQESERFEVGNMASQGSHRQMTIYAFATPQELVSTLVHEFGHALGIGHTAQPTSMMYHSQHPDQQQLTAVDLTAFAQACPQASQ
jgi:Sec-independent protein translocase protein TatA